jgi:hypothetical protein
MRRFIRGVAIATVLLGGAGMIGVVVAGAQRRGVAASQPIAPPANVTDRDLLALGRSRLFFAHMSVGYNILSGVNAVYADHATPALPVVDVSVDDPLPAASSSPVVISTEIGRNGDPLGKLRNFDSMLRSGLAAQIDVAIIKFCYVDVVHGTDVDALFATYRSTLDALERDFPEVTFLHSTVPLTVGPRSLKDHVKVLLGRDHNAYRQRYNALIRQTYGPNRLFDLAAVESTAPDGSASAVLQDEYSSDGEHLNERGSQLAARSLIRLLAERVAV